MSRVDRAVAEANEAVNEAIRDSYAVRNFEIVRFGRHRDGYLHAQVTLGGAPVYVHCRFGSWLIPSEPQGKDCPVSFGRRAVLKEVLGPYKFTLADEGRRFRDAERKREEPESDGRKSAHKRQARRPKGGGPAAAAAGVPDSGDRAGDG